MLKIRELLAKILTWIEAKDYKGYGPGVDLSTYTSSSNMFTAPSDGVIRLVCTYRSASYVILYSAEGTNLAELATSTNANAQGNLMCSTPICKGMQVYINRSSTYSGAAFYPYTT